MRWLIWGYEARSTGEVRTHWGMAANKSHTSACKDMFPLLSRKCHWTQQPHMTQERESVSHFWIRASKIRSKRKAWSLPWPKQDSLSHTGNTCPLYGFPLPFDTYKAVCTQIPHEREGVKLISTSQEMVLLVGFIQPLKFVPKETSATFRSFYSFLFKFQVESFHITYWWVWG